MYSEIPLEAFHVQVKVVVAGAAASTAMLLHDTVHVLPTALLLHAAVLSSVLAGGVVHGLAAKGQGEV